MKNIQPVSIWFDGEQKQATKFSLISAFDDLSSKAKFYYQLIEDNGTTIAEGETTMDGQDYQNWGNNSQINDDAYNWVAAKLNLTIE